MRNIPADIPADQIENEVTKIYQALVISKFMKSHWTYLIFRLPTGNVRKVQLLLN